jgi:hypothetical protein
MGEYDNAGFPLSYCLLTTATAIDAGKRKITLTAWTKCLRDKYGIDPLFVHVDKDLAEISAARATWKAKINLCYWHLRRAVNTRLAKAKLATTVYDVKRACNEFDFIDPDFRPSRTKFDIDDYEGGLPDDVELPEHPRPGLHDFVASNALSDATNSLRIKIPPPTQITAVGAADTHENQNKENMKKPDIPASIIHGQGFVLLLKPPIDSKLPSITLPNDAEISDEEEEEADQRRNRRTFCPSDYREPILKMIERHYCAHPLIPGYAAPSDTAIRRWAVQQMYGFCSKNDLPEVWAYMWENWYRRGRWELWARSAHEQIPVLKTTMILESQSVNSKSK